MVTTRMKDPWRPAGWSARRNGEMSTRREYPLPVGVISLMRKISEERIGIRLREGSTETCPMTLN